MSSPNPLTLNGVIENIVEDVLREREREEQDENQEIILTEEVREEARGMEGTEEEARVFLTEKWAEAFRKNLAKKGFIKERGFRELIPLF